MPPSYRGLKGNNPSAKSFALSSPQSLGSQTTGHSHYHCSHSSWELVSPGWFHGGENVRTYFCEGHHKKNFNFRNSLCAVRLRVSKGAREGWLFLIFIERRIFCGMFCFPVFSNMKNYSSQCKILLFVINRNSQKKPS